jgi:DNA-binding transcriptional ArsR family regulator
MNALQSQARMLKVLAHPTRLRLLYALRGSEECVCHLTTLLRQRQAYVSQQLMFLRKADLLEDRKDGSRVYYHIKDPTRLFQILDAVDLTTGTENGFSPSPVIAACPCPKCQASQPGEEPKVKRTRVHRKQK